jgi:hypothetical protein
MAQQTVNVGTVAGDNTGDPGRTAFQKINANFDELYSSTAGATGLIQLSSVSGTNTITATASTAFTTYVSGQAFELIATGTNTGATTINVSSKGAKTIQKLGGTALTAGDIVSGSAYILIYDGTNIQLVSPSTIQTSQLQALSVTASILGNSGSELGYRNKIINGDMRIDQRLEGAGFTLTAGASLVYVIDRFYAYCTGANVTANRIAGSGSTQYRLQLIGQASVTGIGLAQRIEQADSYDLAGTTCTLSVDIANSLLTTVNWAAYYANSTNAFGTVASPTRTSIASGSFTVTSSVVRYSTNISIPAAATTGIEIVFTVGAQISGSLVIGNIQLEQGSNATPFERVPFAYQLIRCQRFYQKSYNQGTAQGTATVAGQMVGRQGSATALADCLTSRLAPAMFATPTVLWWSPATGTLNRIRDITGAADLTFSAASGYEGQMSTGYPQLTAAVTANNQLAGHWTAVAEIP